MNTKRLLTVAAICLGLSSVHAQVPGIINYQGRIVDGGTNFNGTGQFEFALVNSNATVSFWSNDGSSVAGSQPALAVPVTVSQGSYSVLLGDTTLSNMTVAIPSSAFTNSSVRLRVWFTDGVTGFQQLSPDQRIAAVGYALVAATVPNGAITSNNIAAGAVGATQIAVGAVGSTQIAAGAVGSSQLASNLTVTGVLAGNGGGLSNVTGTVVWQAVTGTNQQAQSNNGYLANNASPVTITLPSAPNVGDIVRVTGIGAGGWQIAQNTGQTILAVAFGLSYTNWNSLTNWAQTSAFTGEEWRSVASSANGTKLVAAGGYAMYTSTNSGSSWIPASASSEDWTSVASSADGTKLVAGIWEGGIYTSTNSGSSWTQTSALTGYWDSGASSADGTKLVAGQDGGIYTSTNSGSSWTLTSAPSAVWSSIASSVDGTKLVAVGGYQWIYISTNSGSSWIQTSAPDEDWTSVASSADGTKLVAGTNGGGIYTSTNSGSLWTLTSAPSPPPEEYWSSIASSADGTKLAATVGLGGGIYTSTNSGSSWTLTSAPSASWLSIAASADGTKLVAAVYEGGIYTAQATIQTTTTPGPAGGLTGGQNSAIELQYIGNGQFMPISYVGAISAY